MYKKYVDMIAREYGKVYQGEQFGRSGTNQ